MRNELLQLLISQAWQITTLAIVAAIVVKLAAKNRPHLAHALWVLVLIKCVTPPLWEHSLGVFSQLQARLMPDESGAFPDEIEPPETYEPDDLRSMADTEPPKVMRLLWDGGMGLELDKTVQRPEEFRVNTGPAESPLPLESIASPVSWLHPGWLLLRGLAAGAIITMLIMVFRCVRCLRLIHRHRTTEFDDQLRERVQQLSRQLRIRRVPQIIVSEVLFGPAVLGLLRHTIVLPRCLFEKTESRVFDVVPSPPSLVEKVADRPDEGADRATSPFDVQPSFLDPILAHELLHIRRGDLLTGTLQAIVQSLWWFHPAVWFSNRRLSREAERCCDEQVIAEPGCSPAQYARSLLSVIECKHQLQPVPVFPGMKPVEITTHRMERIMSLRKGLTKQTPLWCWLTVVTLAFVVLPGAAANPSSDDPDSSPVTEPESELPAHSLNAKDVATAFDSDDSVVAADEVETQDIVIKGRVRRPGRYDVSIRPKTSMLDAIALAGGLADELSDKIWIVRSERNVTEPVLIRGHYRDALKDPDQDIQISTGDLIVVDEATFACKNANDEQFLFDEAELPPGSMSGDSLRESLRQNVSMTTPPEYSLSRLIRECANFHRIHAAFDVSLLTRADNPLEEPAPIMTMKNKPLALVLGEILAPTGLTFEVRHSGILVVPADDVDRGGKTVLPPLSVMVYPVADLVVPVRNVAASKTSPIKSSAEASRVSLPPAAIVPHPIHDQAAEVHWSGANTDEYDQTIKVDFAPLLELIKASVDPDSWDERVTVAVEEATLSLIIRQSEVAHKEIQELLSQLRDAQDQSVQIQCLVVRLTTESQTKWLEEQCSLHPLEHGLRWALLPPQRCESFTQALLEQKPEVISMPVVRTISGQTASMRVGTWAAGGTATATTGIRLEVTPHQVPNSKVIRMQHSFSVGEFADEMPMSVESLVGSGQTLLLVSDPEDHEAPGTERSHYLLMMTPEHIPQVAEEAASGATSDDTLDAATAVSPTER